MQSSQPGQPDTIVPYARPSAKSKSTSVVATYVWLIAKNIVGWILILSSWALGLISPIPIGFFLFLVGFGLIWFPGKRRLVARVLSGRRVPRNSKPFRIGLAAAALLLPTLLLVYLVGAFHLNYQLTISTVLLMGGIYFAAAVVTMTFVESLLELANQALAFAPRMRRRARPWLKRHGIRLLPPRRSIPAPRKPGSTSIDLDAEPADQQEIIRLDDRHRNKAIAFWQRIKKWAKPAAGALITIAIFVFLGQKVKHHWDQVRGHVEQISYPRVLLGSAMFALFLLVFRVTSWRRIVAGFGYALPLPPSARIWSCSELARYLPLPIWQVVGRVYLCKPYGISGVACATSQILELIVFLLANVLTAISCLSWFGFKHIHEKEGHIFILALSFVPILLAILHPKVFYGLTNRVLARMGRPSIVQRLSGKSLIGLLGLNLAGLLWQSMAIWLVVSGPLHLEFTKWWVVAGSYCLAWCAGFLAFWAAGGLGIRELIFVGAMRIALPDAARQAIGADPKVLTALLIFTSILLRLWATVGELILAGFAVAWDHRGAFGSYAPLDAQAASTPQANDERSTNLAMSEVTPGGRRKS